MVRSTLRILSNNLVRKSIAKAVSDHPDIHEILLKVPDLMIILHARFQQVANN